MSYYLETLNLGYETKHLEEQKSIKILEVSLSVCIGTCFGVFRKCFKLKSTNCRTLKLKFHASKVTIHPSNPGRAKQNLSG